MVRVLLVRHAESEWNADGRWQGWADPPLSKGGTEASWAAADDPSLDDLEVAVASDLERARTTAATIAGRRAWPPVEIMRGLRERGAGAWTGLTRPEIEERWPGALRHSPADIPDGESVGAVTARAVVALHRIAELYPDAGVLAVSHGALIRALEHHLGVAVASVPNLGGRWIEVNDGQLCAGPLAGPLGKTSLERTA